MVHRQAVARPGRCPALPAACAGRRDGSAAKLHARPDWGKGRPQPGRRQDSDAFGHRRGRIHRVERGREPQRGRAHRYRRQRHARHRRQVAQSRASGSSPTWCRPPTCSRWLDGRKLDAVIHLGAISDTTATDADLVMETNFRLSLRLLDWCTETRTPFIYASSAATYRRRRARVSRRLVAGRAASGSSR